MTGRPENDTPLVSILIVSFRQHQMLARLLDTLDEATDGIATETIVVVNGVPLQPEHHEARARGATVVQTPVNLGFPGGLQHARSLARGEHFAILQDDTVVDEGWLSSLLSVLEAEPTVGLVGSRMAFLDGEAYGDGMLVASDGWVTILEPSPREPASWAVDACFSASCLVRRQAWDSVGGPNPRLFPLWMVDVEFGIRLNESDWSVVMVRDAHARHATHGSTTSWLRRYLDDRHRRVVTRAHRAYLADRPSGLFGPEQVEFGLAQLAASARTRADAAPPARVALPTISLEQLTAWARVDARRLRLTMPWFRVRSAVGYRMRVVGRSLQSRVEAS